MAMGLTPAQDRVHRFIASENAAGRSPDTQAIADHVGYVGRGAAVHILHRLSERGRVMRYFSPSDLKNGLPGRLIAIGS